MNQKLKSYFYLITFTVIGIMSSINFSFSSLDASCPNFLSQESNWTHKDLELKKALTTKSLNAKIEVSESEVKSEEFITPTCNLLLDFSLFFNPTNSFTNSVTFIINKCTYSKYINYLSSITSRTIFFCVFRI